MDDPSFISFVREFRGVMGQLPTGVSVLIASTDGDLHAMTAGSVVLASYNPPLVAVFVAREARMHARLLRAGRFTISVLEAGDSLSARRFARPGRENGAGQPGPEELMEREEGPPVLRAAISWLDCEVNQVTEVGDHSCFVGKVVEMGRRYGAQPLIYCRGRFHDLGSAQNPGQHVTIDPAELITNW